MKKRNRFLTVLMAALLTVSTVCFAVSCDGSQSFGPGSDTASGSESQWTSESDGEAPSRATFFATVLRISGHTAWVEPLEGEDELRSASQITFGFADKDIGAEVGDTVEINYNGYIMESYPAQIEMISWKITEKAPSDWYADEWLDKVTAKKYEDGSDDFVITEIYANCFFVQYIIPSPQTVKINGALGDEWCVGDHVKITYTEMYYVNADNKMEGDLVSIEASTFELEPGLCYKPVIYLYPETEMQVSVNLTIDGKLTCTYPAYNNGWTVTAAPDGTLTDANGQTYNYLYWEGITDAAWDMSRGFCVKGEDTAAFLEDALAKLGLTRREANEFIVYWLPLMQENRYNIISFQTDVYTEAAELMIDPQPDTLIRVFMAYEASDTYVDIEAQDLTAPERHGFTVVEWGGSEIAK